MTFCGDRSIARLNAQWRNKARPTDVLAFPLRHYREPVVNRDHARGSTEPLGDVVISYDTALRQATDYGGDLRSEVARLWIHGCLHLLGFDHEQGVLAARAMRREERRLRKLVELT